VTPPRKTTALKQLLRAPSLDFLLEAHNALSAQIVEEAGFPAIWASGLTLSASLGVRDNNEITWTQMLDLLEFMSDATSIPILVDGDTGHGNFNTVRRLVAKLRQRGIAGVCLEDKLFPKTNSFLRSEAQPLADAEEFCGKIKAGRDASGDDDFVILARTEALIAGHPLAEALRRAEAYRLAGADAVVVHAKEARPDAVFAFLKEWGNRLPVVLIPTKYYATPTAAFRERGVSALIWANHLLRGALGTMQQLAGQIRREESLVGIEDRVAPLAEVFRLQGDAELAAAEKRYLRPTASAASAIILAAGGALDGPGGELPKTLLKIGRESILERIVAALRANQIETLTVVAGYKKELVALPGLRRVDNDHFATTGELASLAVALPHAEGDTLVTFGDVLFRSYIAGLLLRDPADVVIAVDAQPRKTADAARRSDFVRATRAGATDDFLDDAVLLEHAEFAEASAHFHGEWIGLVKLSPRAVGWTREFLAVASAPPAGAIIDLLNHFVRAGRGVKIHYIRGHWIDVDSLPDLDLAQRFSP
jgi:phosphoenolpyruvate phosphomutase